MRRTLLVLAALSAPAQALAAEASDPMLGCYNYAQLAYQLFAKRDAGETPQQQIDLWKKIPESDPTRGYYLTRAQTVIEYAYGGQGAKMTPQEARTAFFQGCRQSSAANVAPPPLRQAPESSPGTTASGKR